MVKFHTISLKYLFRLITYNLLHAVILPNNPVIWVLTESKLWHKVIPKINLLYQYCSQYTLKLHAIYIHSKVTFLYLTPYNLVFYNYQHSRHTPRKTNLDILHPLHPPGSYLDRPSVLLLVGVKPTRR